MSIRNRRLQEMTERILKEQLQLGNLPTSKEFIWRLSQAMRELPLDEPEFRFRAFNATEATSSALYNQQIEKAIRDFTLLYGNIVEVHQLLNKHFSSFETERAKLEARIDQLQNELKEKILLYASDGFLASVFDHFDNVEKVDLPLCENIVVDTTHHQVRLAEEANTSKRVVPAHNTSFEMIGQPKYKITKLTGNIQDVYADELDTVWQITVQKEKNELVQACLESVYGMKTMVNRLELDLLTVESLQLRIEFTPDGTTWFYLPYHEDWKPVAGKIVYDFPALEVKGFRFWLEKGQADQQVQDDDGFVHSYLFGVKHIRLYCKQYPTSGVFYGKSLAIKGPDNFVVNKVSLDVEEEVPTGTNLRYEVAVPRIDGTEEWRAIDPIRRKNPKERQIIDFSNITGGAGTRLFFPEGKSPIQYEAEDLSRNGVYLYRLTSLEAGKEVLAIPNKKVIANTARMYVAKNAWDIQAMPSTRPKSALTIEEWLEIKETRSQRYQKIDPTTNMVLSKEKRAGKHVFLCKIGVLYEGEEKAHRVLPVCTDPLTIYLNGQKVFEGETSTTQAVNLVFKKGWNEIVALIDGNTAALVNGLSFGLGADLMTLGSYLAGDPVPMKEIPVFDLQYNTKIDERGVFALREVEGGTEVLLNYADPGIEYELFFDYVDDDTLDKAKEIKLRVFFDKENVPLTGSPILKHYRIQLT